MSLLVVGISHRTAPMSVVEQVVLGAAAGGPGLRARIHGQEDVSEAVVVTTCNRLEVYTEAETFHGAVAQVGDTLATAAGVPLEELTEHLYVHYEDRAVSHLFSLTCGLDSMAVGERQVLGQVRAALSEAQDDGHAGTVLNPLFQHALRVGKKAHTETALDRVSHSLVSLALEQVSAHLPEPPEVRAVLIGAGAMSGLAAATLERAGVCDLVVVNRTRSHADRLVQRYGGRAAEWTELDQLVGAADLVITTTGAPGTVLDAQRVTTARGGRSQPLAVIDLAMPHDVDPAVGQLPDVRLWGLAQLQEQAATLPPGGGAGEKVLDEVHDLVTGEVAAYLAARRVHEVGPTVAALRARAAQVVEAELHRLGQRLPDLPEQQAAEVRRAVQRVVDKLLHTPTVRVKELAGSGPSGPPYGDYAAALRELFDLDPHDVATVSAPPAGTDQAGRGIR